MNVREDTFNRDKNGNLVGCAMKMTIRKVTQSAAKKTIEVHDGFRFVKIDLSRVDSPGCEIFSTLERARAGIAAELHARVKRAAEDLAAKQAALPALLEKAAALEPVG